MAPAPNLRDQKLARTIDKDIAPLWHARFARPLWRQLPALESGMVLDIHSGAGRTVEELLTRLPESVRVLGLEPSESLRALAKARMRPEWKRRVYLKAGDATAVADMADDLYDVVVANLVLSEAHELSEAFESLLRVTKPGGTLLASLPLRGTWNEAEDLLREVLRDSGLDAAQNRLRRMANLRPSGPELDGVLRGLGLSPEHFVVAQERFELLFGSGREFLFSPLVEFGPLPLWKAVTATQGDPQQTFFRFKEAIDAYCSEGLLAVTVVAGAVTLRKPAPGESLEHLPGAIDRARYPELAAIWAAAEADGGASLSDSDGEIDIDLDDAGGGRAEVLAYASQAGADEANDAVVPKEHADSGGDSAEDDALRALLETPAADTEVNVGDDLETNLDSNLDALLDQVLEFDAKPDLGDAEELDADELEMIDVDPRRPGETLKRIKALLPPPPKAPPPPPKKPK